MSNGNAGLIRQDILRENKITLYKLHPDQNVFFGHVITMPNLPNGLHEAELWRNKGHKANPRDLMPDAKVEHNTGGEIFLVPQGYKLESYIAKTEFEKKLIDVTLWRVVREENPPEEKEEAPLYIPDKPKVSKKK